MKRRSFLRGLGGITLALPWLERLHGVASAQQATGPRRVIAVAYEMGVPLGQWRPSGSGASMSLPYVTAPLEPWKDRCLFVSAIDNDVLAEGGNSFIFGHPAKKEACLTATLTTGAFPTSNTNHVSEVRADAETTGGANGPSVEQLIGEYLRNGQASPSVNLAVDGNKTSPYPSPDLINSNFFFESRGNAITLETRPRAAFDRLFAGLLDSGPSQADVALQQLRARNKSVLDAVRASFVELSQGLGREDRNRLEEHAARIRQLELDLTPSAACSAPDGVDAVADYKNYRMDQLAPLQNRVLAHAMACDLAPVGRLEYANQQNPRFGIAALDSTLDSVDEYDWHAMVHGDPLPGTTAYLRPGRGEDTTYDSRLLDGYRFFVQRFADLLAELAAIPEGPDTSVLDNSLLILASDLGEGLGHGHMKMGYILAGNLGGARTGFHLDAGPNMPFEPGGGYFYTDSRFNVTQLLHSTLDMAGVVDAQGNPVEMGLGGFLAKAGMPRRIDALF
jgi:hypothetical protein